MTIQECYQILQVSPEASLDEIKRSFRKLAFDLHPDLHPDDPRASRKFQRLNEAYILLRKAIESGEFPKDGKEQARGQADREKPERQAHEKSRAQSRTKAQAGTKSFHQGPPPGTPTAEERARERMRRKYAENERFFYHKEEVLQDILKDPFARKVFEDIYSQVRTGGHHATKTAPKEIKKRKLELEWGKRTISIDLSQGIVGSIKSWMQGQMDVHKTIRLPMEQLKPGRIVRIKISTGLSRIKHAIEVRLPGDFVVGKSIRLRGLGRKLAGLHGDMYLRILAK